MNFQSLHDQALTEIQFQILAVELQCAMHSIAGHWAEKNWQLLRSTKFAQLFNASKPELI